jgi:hypothetical protein
MRLYPGFDAAMISMVTTGKIMQYAAIPAGVILASRLGRVSVVSLIPTSSQCKVPGQRMTTPEVPATAGSAAPGATIQRPPACSLGAASP